LYFGEKKRGSVLEQRAIDFKLAFFDGNILHYESLHCCGIAGPSNSTTLTPAASMIRIDGIGHLRI
jgi:hypothetical protein